MRAPAARQPLHDADPLDSRLAGLQAADALPPRRAGGFARALTSPHTRGLVLLPLGFALGSSGLNLLSEPALAFADPLVSVALAMLGVLVGLALDTACVRERRLAGPAVFESVLTILLVGGGGLALHAAWTLPGHVPWLPVLMLGICASVSFSPAVASADRASLRLVRLGDVDNVLAITFGALLLTLHRQDSATGVALLFFGLSLVAVSIAAAGWLLVGHASSDSEQHAFVAGTLLLLGGGAAYLSQSALFFGLLAGVLWGGAGGPARERIARDVRYVQHPLGVLLLLVAGARLVLGIESLAMAVVYVLGRTAGKVSAAWLLARSGAAVATPDLPFHLIAPGIAAIGLALNALQAWGVPSGAGALLAAVALGTLATDALLIATSRPEDRP